MPDSWTPRSVEDLAEHDRHADHVSPTELYHENSKLRANDQGLYSWISVVNSSPQFRAVISRPAMARRGYPKFALPPVGNPKPDSFASIAARRRSRRQFSGEKIAQEDLARILFLANGVTSEQEDNGARWRFRMTPSGGGLFPVELYCAVHRVDDTEPGLYAYLPESHEVQRLIDGDLTEALVATMPSVQDLLEQASVVIVLACNLPRIRFKYGERAYRFALIEAGHIGQNILLATTEMGVSAVPLGAFLDDELNSVVKLDGIDQFAVYVVAVGRRPSASDDAIERATGIERA